VPGGKNTFWHDLQYLDYIYLLTVAQGWVGLGRPISCIGNNMAVRKSAYQAVGGFKKIGFSITEDFALCQAVTKLDKQGVIFNARPTALMSTAPVGSLGDFLQQRRRWVMGGLGHGWVAPLVLIFVLALHVLLAVSFVACMWSHWQMAISISFFLIIVGTNFPLLFRGCVQTGNCRPLGNILAFQVFYIFYTIAVSLMVLGKRNITWKDKDYIVRN
jgi:1,2-diacylglycerol 3-beta-glucosyltransferase